MTDMNKEVPNPVYNYMNSDKEERNLNLNQAVWEATKEFFSNDFEEIRKRKRENFIRIAREVIDKNVDVIEPNVYEDLAIALFDSGQVN